MNTASVSFLILGALASVVLCVGRYVSQKELRQIGSGFGIAGGILLGALLLGFLVVGVGVAFFGVESSRISSKPLAFIVAAISLCLIAFFIQRWAKYFSGWMAWGVFNALLMVSSGHLINNPSVPVSRSLALTMAGLIVIAVISSVRFKTGYKLNAIDKIALLLWVLAFAVAANSDRYGLEAVAGGSAGLVLASIYHRYDPHRLHTKRESLHLDSR